MAESEHGAAQEALALEGEACRKAKEENERLMDERLALIMELGTIKDEFAAFREKVVADRETMEAEFGYSGNALFNYGYGCCVFTHNIWGASLTSRMECRILQSRSSQSSLRTPAAPQASRQPLLLWTPLPLAGRIVRRVARPLPKKKRFFQ